MTAPPVAGTGVRRSWTAATGPAGRSRGVRALPAVVVSLAGLVAAEAKPGDIVVLLGAGDITQWAYALPAQLEALKA